MASSSNQGRSADRNEPRDAVGDLINLFAAPVAGGIRAMEQARRGSEELINTIEKLNRTLDNLNQTSERINTMLAEFEEPIRAAMPQLTRTIRTADELTQLVEEPLRSLAPNLQNVVNLLTSPSVTAIPNQFAEMTGLLREMTGGLAPLVQLADNAGGLLSAFRIPGIPSSGSSKRATPQATRTSDDDVSESTQKESSQKKSASKKSAPKKTAARKSSPQKSSPQKSSPRKSAQK